MSFSRLVWPSSPPSSSVPPLCLLIVPCKDDLIVQPGPPPPRRWCSGARGTRRGVEVPHAAVSNKHIVSAGCAVRVQRVTMRQQRVHRPQRSRGRGVSRRQGPGTFFRAGGRRRKDDGDLEDTTPLLTRPHTLLSS